MGAEPPGTDPPQGFDIDDRELEQFIADWEAVDRQAARVLREALGEHRGARGFRMGIRKRSVLGYGRGWRPASIRSTGSAGLPASIARRPPMTGTELLLRCVAATISPREDTGLDIDEEAMLSSIEHADWIGAIVSAVRAGPGANASTRSLVAGIAACPEVEPGPGGDSDDDVAFLESAFSILAVPWRVLGMIDGEERLTALGVWALPRSLARAWGSDFDAED